MSNPLSQSRQTGTEKSGDACPRCGTTLPVVTSAYGSTTVGACSSCSATEPFTQLEAQVAAATEVSEPEEEEGRRVFRHNPFSSR